MSLLFLVVGLTTQTSLHAHNEESLIQSFCAQIVEEMSRWEFVPAAALRANDVSQDAIERALWYRSYLPSTLAASALPFEVRTPRRVSRDRPFPERRQTIETSAWVIPQTRSGWPNLRALPDSDLESILYIGAKDTARHQSGGFFTSLYPGQVDPYSYKLFEFRPNSHSQAVVSWTGGFTGVASHAGRVFNQVRLMNSDRTDGITAELLRSGRTPLWVPTSAVTVDVPFHGGGPVRPELFDLDGSLNWRRNYFGKLKQHGLPVVAGCRSGESLLLGELNQRYPGTVDAMIWMSPMTATRGYYQSLKGYREDAVLPGVPLNPMAFRWFTGVRDELVRQSTPWWEKRDPTNGTPLLILVGSEDPEVSPEARREFQRWARENPDHIFYVEIPGAGHDVFNVTEDTDGNRRVWTATAESRAAHAWSYVYWYLRSQVLTRRPPPPYGWMSGS